MICKDCGLAYEPWHNYAHPGSAGCRCHRCYLAYIRAKQSYNPPRRIQQAPLRTVSCRCGLTFTTRHRTKVWCSRDCKRRWSGGGGQKVKPAHHKGTHHARSAKLRAAANADLTTRCWRCGRTLAEVRQERPHARWTAGHLIDGVPESPLAPECSPCNFAAGARRGNRLRAQRRATRRTELTW